MQAINFEQANTVFKADNCFDLPVDRSFNSKTGFHSLTSCWEPNEEELEYIKQCIENNEKPKIYLSILGLTQPPIWVGCNLYEDGDNHEE